MTVLDYITRKRKELEQGDINEEKKDNSLKIVEILKLKAEDTNKPLPQVVREHNLKNHNLENLFPHYFL